MTPTLPSHSLDAVRLAEVLSSSVAAVSGASNSLGLPAVSSAVVILVDGLGAHNLRARAGHARTLMTALHAKSTAISPFPSTTAAALATLTTAAPPGQHGLVGYSIWNHRHNTVLNQLTGWGPNMPGEWQRLPTMFERATQAGMRASAIGLAKFSGSGFSRSVLRGAEYVPANSLRERFERAVEASATPGVSYLYVSELDAAGHAYGWESDRWLARLEELDGTLRDTLPQFGKRTGIIVTADHGMVDIPHHRHVLIDEEAPHLAEAIIATAGDPRAMGVWLGVDATPSDRTAHAAGWQEVLGDRCWALSREAAIDAGLYGPVDPEVRDRIGDVVLIARKNIALFESRSPTPQSRHMIGQHGAVSDEEVRVPLLRFGAFA